MSMTTASSDSSGGNNNMTNTNQRQPPPPSRYESQKRRDWNTFGQYLKNHRPPLALSRCSGAHVLEFLRYLDQFGKTKVHLIGCPFFGQPNPPAPCPCPLRQAWGSLDALIGRLRAAFEENGGQPETNPFGARAVRLYLREIRDSQSKARGIAYEKKKRKKPPPASAAMAGGSRPVAISEKLQVGDLNSSTSTTVGYEYDRLQQLTHYQFRDNFGRHLVFGSSGDVSGGMNASTSGGHGGSSGASDERLLLFHCSPGSLL